MADRNMVRPSIDPVDDDVRPLVELVQIPRRHDAAKDPWCLGITIEQHHFARLAAQGSMHCLDDVAALTERPQSRLDSGCQRPSPVALFPGQTQAGEHLQATE